MALYSKEDEAAETFERSIRMAPVQRRGLAVACAALAASAWSIGWLALLPVVGAFVAFLVIKAPPVQLRLGVWSTAVVWGFGEIGLAGGVLLSQNPPELLIGILAVPTLLGSVVWPRRWVITATIFTAAFIMVIGLAADLQNFVDNFAAFGVIAAMAIAASLLTLVAREAESVSREDTRVDALTAVGNRLALADVHARLSKAPYPRGLGLLVADIDLFKQINDDFGHEVGNRTLADVAGAMARVVGDRGEVFRFGGEEFVVVLEGSSTARALIVAEDIRVAVEALRGPRPVTISIGVAGTDAPTSTSMEQLFERADGRLLTAKRRGRNAVVVDDDDPAPMGDGVQPRDMGMPATSLRQRFANIDVGGGSRRRDVAGVRQALQRLHLVNMTERQCCRGRLVGVMLLVVLAACIPVFGIWPVLTVGLGLGIYRVTQRRVGTFRRPERAIGAAWIAAQLGVAAAVVLAERPALWALSTLSLMLVTSSAAFPGRFVIAGSAFSLALVVAAALIIDPNVFVTAPEALASAITVMVCAVITGRAVGRLASQARSVASHDVLTGLPNRVACEITARELLQLWVAQGVPLAIMIGDLDHFKAINDTVGHSRGDQVLVELVHRLTAQLRSGATMFRIGGEEFAVLVSGADAAEARAIAERLRRSVASAPLAGQRVTISFGVAVALPGGSDDFGRMCVRADAALYAAKDAGRNTVKVDGDAMVPPVAATGRR